MKYVLVFICVAGLGFMLQSTDPATNPWNASAIEFDRTPVSMPCLHCGSDCICDSCVCKEQECLTTPVSYVDEYVKNEITTEDQFRILRKYTDSTDSCTVDAQGNVSCQNRSNSNNQSSYGNSSGPVRRLGSRLRGFFSRFRCRGC